MTAPTPETTTPTPTTNTNSKQDRRQMKVDLVGELVSLLQGTATLFLDPSGTPYVTLPPPPSAATARDKSACGTRTLRLSDSDVRDWLRLRMWAERTLSVSTPDLDGALGILAAHVKENGPTEPVYTRLAPAPHGENGLYLDLGTGNQAVYVTAEGWQVMDLSGVHPPVHFQRPAGFLSLPEPTPAGPDGLAELRRLLNVGDGPDGDDRFRLLVGWLVGCLMPDGDYPVLMLNGQKGSAKTTTMRLLRSLVDPHEAVENAAPDKPEDLLLQAAQTHISSFDNLHSVRQSFSDALCRLATGMSAGKRKLYSDDTRLITKVRRPAILNGIPDLARADDLVQRSLRVRLPAISASQRQLRRDLERAFAAAGPRLLGALLDAVVVALRERAALDTTLTERPRLADFYVWVVAAAGSGRLGFTADEFADTFWRCQEEGRRLALDANPVTEGLLSFLDSRPGRRWEGTMADLLADLTEAAAKRLYIRDPHVNWPSTVQSLTNRLDAAEGDLAEEGLTIQRLPRSHQGRRVVLSLTPVTRPVTSVTRRDEATLDPRHGLNAEFMGTRNAVTRRDEGVAPLLKSEEREEERGRGEGATATTRLVTPITDPHDSPLLSVTRPSEGPRHATSRLDTPSAADTVPDAPETPPDPWKVGYSLLPRCPDPRHRHHGPRCQYTQLPTPDLDCSLVLGLPMALKFSDDVKEGLNSLTALPSPIDVSLPLYKARQAFMGEAAAAYLESVGTPLPDTHPYVKRLAGLRESYDAAQRRLTCPHTGERITRVMASRGGKTATHYLCADCGDDLSKLAA